MRAAVSINFNVKIVLLFHIGIILFPLCIGGKPSNFVDLGCVRYEGK